MTSLAPPKVALPTYPWPGQPEVITDPLPEVTVAFQRFGAFEREATSHAKPTVKAMGAALGAATATVQALSDNPIHYSVRFAKVHTAGVSHHKKQVIIGTRALTVQDLTDGQRAAILIAFAMHEVGHIRWSEGWDKRLKHNLKSGEELTWGLKAYNVASDVMLEHLQPIDYPGFREGLPIKALFNSSAWTVSTKTKAQRFAYGLQFMRYRFATDWTKADPADLAFWAELQEDLESKKALGERYMLSRVRRILEFIRPSEPDPPEEEEEPEPEPPQGGEEEEEDDEPYEGPVEPGEGKGDDPEETEEGEPEESEPDGGEGKGTSEEEGDEEEGEGEGESESKEGSTESEGSIPTLHGPESIEDDAEWQERIDELEKVTAHGRDLRIVGTGRFQKREVRIVRIGKES